MAIFHGNSENIDIRYYLCIKGKSFIIKINFNISYMNISSVVMFVAIYDFCLDNNSSSVITNFGVIVRGKSWTSGEHFSVDFHHYHYYPLESLVFE